MNLCIFTGNIGSDLILEKTEKGVSFVRFSLAVDNVSDKENPHWFDFIIWNKYAESFYQYLRKGDRILIRSSAQQNVFEKEGIKKYRVQFTVEKFEILKTKNKDSSESDIDFSSHHIEHDIIEY